MDLLEAVRGCTFDDFLLAPQRGVVLRRDPRAIDLRTLFSRHLPLSRPLVSANMDTITRAAMAIVLAEEGGLGVIDRGYRSGDIQPQVQEVAAVKRTQHGIISDPHTIGPSQTIGEAIRKMRATRVGSLAVVDDRRRLAGLLTERDVRFVGVDLTVADRMTPRERLVVHVGPIALPDAAQLMAREKVKKLPLVDADGGLAGLVTARDLIQHQRHPFATRDGRGRLRVGAAIGAAGDYLERAAEAIRAGADVLVIDIAHGHSAVMERAIEAVRKRFGEVELVAGNVATGEGAAFLADRGVDAVKVGIGPGGGCATRLTTSFGIPQVEALVQCRLAVGDRVPLIADGGVKRDGSIAQALLFGADTVMLGSALAGTEETPGEIVMKPLLMGDAQKVVQVPFKVFRGMASIGAIRDRLDLEEAEPQELEAFGAEGIEVSVPARGSVRGVIADMLKHLCSSISYGGAESLADLRQRFWNAPDRYLVKLTPASRAESFQR
ncbi:MAG: IMP dehydrogenase [Acidobacteria bacterium]|nr:IMP dehydrogenase [Acidobacteriota bacterium]